jgi:hypothetical protein
MSYTKGNRAYDNRRPCAVLFHHTEQKTAENNLFNKSHVYHREHIKENSFSTFIYIEAIPQINRNYKQKRKKIQIFTSRRWLFQSVKRSFVKSEYKRHQTYREKSVYHRASKIKKSEILHAE